MVPQQLDQKFNDARPFLNELKRHLTDTLAAFADSRNFPFVGRIKTPESIAEKIEMGRYARFSEIDDLVAFTLVIPTASVEQEVVDFCKSTFDVIEVRDKRTTPKSPDVFRFDSTRVIARARRAPDLGDYKGPSIYEYLFEVQVRTAFEHAWSVATHDLVYKGSSIDWKRIRLAAQLKASSEGLDAAVAVFDHLATAINQSPWKRVSDQIEVSNYISRLFQQDRLPSFLKPASVARFVENFCTLVRSIQPRRSITSCLYEIDNELQRLGPTSIPVSLSLYQFFLGMLCHRGLVTTIQNLQCHVTPELAAIFPGTKGIGSVFDYDS